MAAAALGDAARHRLSDSSGQLPTTPLDAALASQTSAVAAPPFAPVAEGQRIEALDVVRGFALFGIFLMNIEWFNRPIAELGSEGMPRGLSGADWLASWFIAYFVQGKFWTIFSLLFGMGFAVMLVRAERAGREFIGVYLRRILALAVFGAVHFIYVWEGDILFSYAVGALGLLIVLYARPLPLGVAGAVLVGLGLVTDSDLFFRVAGGLAAAALLALYLRGERRLSWRGASIPLASFILMAGGAAMAVAAPVFWLWADAPIEPRVPLTVFGPLLLVTGWLSWKYHAPAEKRALRMAVGLYVFGGVAMTSMSLVEHFAPDAERASAAVAAKPAGAASIAAIGIGAQPASSAAALTPARAASSSGPGPGKAKKTRAERVAEIEAEREKKLKERATRKADEIRIFTTGSYLDTVDWRARRFLDKAANDAGFGVLLVSMFLLGAWFVRSGVMGDTARHRLLFRNLAVVGLPLGIGVGVLTGFIAMSHTPGDRHDGWGIARGLVMLGNLPACLGYVGLVVTMLHSRGAAAGIRVLAPLGRMALTNYLLQSLVCMAVFYGFGLGRWGLPRAQQVLFVAAVFTAQIAFSDWWLARFRYGPMEWLWRGFTYRQVPPMRLRAAA